MKNKIPIIELKWDTRLLKKKIGRLCMLPDYIKKIDTILDGARSKGYLYLTCRIEPPEFSQVRSLESAGFYLTDVGVTLEIKKQDLYLGENLLKVPVNTATIKDIPILKKIIKSLFLHSRFYHDPFFTKDDADKIYQAWIEDAIRGISADKVFWVKNKGFIVCKKSHLKIGEISLIGVANKFRGKGIGRALLASSLKWFYRQGLNKVRVRTQLNNINSLNFYLSAGFKLYSCDMVFGKIL